jgi:hypothetical protein
MCLLEYMFYVAPIFRSKLLCSSYKQLVLPQTTNDTPSRGRAPQFENLCNILNIESWKAFRFETNSVCHRALHPFLCSEPGLIKSVWAPHKVRGLPKKFCNTFYTSVKINRKCLQLILLLIWNVPLATSAPRTILFLAHAQEVVKMAWCGDVRLKQRAVTEFLVAKKE